MTYFLETTSNMKKSTALLCLLLIIQTSAFATIRLPNIIGNHMVLQQKSTVKIWGWGAPEEKLTIKTNWDTLAYEVITKNTAKWEAYIKTPTAGGPYQITIKGSNKIIIDDVMIGEVWVCSGQSNMEWSGNQNLPQSVEEAPKATNNKIRFFYVPKATAQYPQENIEAKWVVCSPEAMYQFSAIGYFYGKALQQSLQIPIGLINANWGGTPAETWTPAYVISSSKTLMDAAAKQNETPWWSNKTGDTYNAMIAPLINYSIAGVIWYQGESNTTTYYGYQELFTKMIDAWRAEWKINFPFYFVQIAPYAYEQKNIGALLREAQSKAATHEKTEMVVVSDLVADTNNIHPIEKIEVAKRLANLALSTHYGLNLPSTKSPTYKSYIIEKENIIITFNNVENGLEVKGGQATSFEIAGADRQFSPAMAIVKGDKVIVFNKKIKNPIAVRFAFNNTSIPNLFSKEGLPVNLFRTDNWEIDTTVLKQ